MFYQKLKKQANRLMICLFFLRCFQLKTMPKMSGCHLNRNTSAQKLMLKICLKKHFILAKTTIVQPLWSCIQVQAAKKRRIGLICSGECMLALQKKMVLKQKFLIIFMAMVQDTKASQFCLKVRTPMEI